MARGGHRERPCGPGVELRLGCAGLLHSAGPLACGTPSRDAGRGSGDAGVGRPRAAALVDLTRSQGPPRPPPLLIDPGQTSSSGTDTVEALGNEHVRIGSGHSGGTDPGQQYRLNNLHPVPVHVPPQAAGNGPMETAGATELGHLDGVSLLLEDWSRWGGQAAWCTYQWPPVAERRAASWLDSPHRWVLIACLGGHIGRRPALGRWSQRQRRLPMTEAGTVPVAVPGASGPGQSGPAGRWPPPAAAGRPRPVAAVARLQAATRTRRA